MAPVVFSCRTTEILECCIFQVSHSLFTCRSMGYDILEVPLLCLRNSNLNLLRKSLNLVSALLEKREWDPLRHLLAEDPGRGIGPPLSQRIMQCANTLFRDIEGQSRFPIS